MQELGRRSPRKNFAEEWVIDSTGIGLTTSPATFVNRKFRSVPET